MTDHAFHLLTPDEPAPERVLRPDARSDFLLTADHAGRAIPRRLGSLGVPPTDLTRHIAWDIGIAAVTQVLSGRLDAAAILQSYSRLVIDCNRRPGVPTSIPEISDGTPIPGNCHLSAAEIAGRQREIFDPYHAAIAAQLEARVRAGRRTVLVSMHSFTPVFGGVPRGMHIGILYNRDRRLAGILLDLLRQEPGLAVGDNRPYSMSDETDYTVPVHAEPRGLPHVEIELRQDLITEAAGQQQWAERLAWLLGVADERLRAACAETRQG
ncbi:MAG: N-formylglutamate amidohydrolase [Alphaproteobacteria bacterium]|nr:N-formylglutamate amidohydrolase [Alphaproteobacteria bacterium]